MIRKEEYKNENLDKLYGLWEKADAIKVGSFISSDFHLSTREEIAEAIRDGENPLVLSAYGLYNNYTSFEFDLDYYEVKEGKFEGEVFYPKGSEPITTLSPSLSVPTMDELVYIGMSNGPRGAEGTSEPIWLFQEKKYWIPPSVQDEYSQKYSCEYMEDVYISSMAFIRDLEDGKVHEYWDTSLVFLSREEAELYGESRSYDYGTKNDHWRVYCISLWRIGKTKSILSAIDVDNLESNRRSN